MDANRFDRLQALFHEALEQPPEARAAFLDAACAGDPDLRAAVERLLAADAAPDPWFDAPPDVAPDPPDGSTWVGRTVGPYRIEKLLGQGGMGAVYLARREDVGLVVALKLVRGDLAAPGHRERLLRERRVLARLHHPHIARLYDAGVADDGTPYFAMEYVDGEDLTTYCDRRRLSVEERLALFEAAGRAVQHAHAHFIVHRDLKPSNILVADGPDGRPVLKLLDFGIARVLAEDDADSEPTLTATGARMLTPAYAAPEQIEGTGVTAATDVYALGVVLYELLTGRRPYEVSGPAGLSAVLTQPPKKPSTVVTTGTTTATVAAARRATPERLQRRLAGDLDVICLKALAKEPERRYASAEAFVEDIRRHLAGLPVQARPDTAAYRVRKFVQRHRLGVGVAAVFLAVLTAVVTLYTLRLQAEREATAREAARSAQVTAFLIDLFREADPHQALGDTLDAYEILARGVERLRAGEMADDPATRASIEDAVSQIYLRLGRFDVAETLAEEALRTRQALYGRLHPDVAASLARLAEVRQRRAALPEADSLLREALAIIEATRGRRHPDWVAYANTRGQVLREQGRYDEAEAVLREALATGLAVHGRFHEAVAFSYDELARVLKERGDYEAALSLNAEALAIADEVFGPGHLERAVYLNNRGSLYFGMGQDSLAELFHRQALAVYRDVLGEEHPNVAIAYTNVAAALQNQGRLEEAIDLYRNALAILRKVHRGPHTTVASVLYNLGNALRAVGRTAEAEPVFREVLAIDRALLGEQHVNVGLDLHVLAGVLREQGDYAAALPVHRQALAVLEAALPAGHRQVGHARTGYGITLLLSGDAAAAERELRRGVATLEAAYEAGHWSLAEARGWLGACLTQRGALDEAEALLTTAYKHLREARGADDRYTRQVAGHLAALYEARGQARQAATYRAAAGG
ncbi:MAG: hypothetical protein KatS3mg042_1674 [Rhodothermaceae bacterium]|nr:MAG: hypothetical protein KatS3mg042_1674 [Rhodothermaceae bacterium]